MTRLGLSVFVFALGAVEPDKWVLTDTAAGYTYHAERWGQVVIDGVCSVEPSDVSCWTPAGKPSAALTASVDAQLKEDGGGPLRLKYRGRNLLLVSSQPPSTAWVAEPIMSDSVPGPGQEMLQQGIQQRGDKVHLLNWLPVRVGERRTEVVVSVPIAQPPARVRFRSGATAEVGPGKLTLGSIHRPAHGSEGLRSAVPPTECELDYRLEGIPTGVTVRFGPVLLGKDGQPLKPAPSSELRTNPDARGPFRYTVFDAPLMFTSKGAWQIHCDPKEIGSIELHPAYRRLVTFRNIALEPKGS